jgi:hypothetical protein
MASLGAASMESYNKSYPIIARLHILHELEQSSKLTNAGMNFLLFSALFVSPSPSRITETNN